MFHDDSIAGSWTALLTRLDAHSAADRWGAIEPALAGLGTVEDIADALAGHIYGDRSDELLGALVRLAAVQADRDGDVLLLVLHLLSGVAVDLARDLGDLHPDIMTLVVGELACQIRTYSRRGRTRAFAENLRLETRRALLAELRPTVRDHTEWGEQLTEDGHVAQLIVEVIPGVEDEELDVIDLLMWSVRSGVDAGGVRLLVQTEQARADACSQHQGAAVDRDVARANGLCERTLYRRRERTLTAVRAVADEYLGAVA